MLEGIEAINFLIVKRRLTIGKHRERRSGLSGEAGINNPTILVRLGRLKIEKKLVGSGYGRLRIY
jgi:hypothetical protein